MSGRESASRPWVGSGIALGIVGLLVLGQLVGDLASVDDIGVLLAIVLIAVIAGLLVARRPDNRICGSSLSPP